MNPQPEQLAAAILLIIAVGLFFAAMLAVML